MTPLELAILGAAALLTSALTAVAGLGGGVILLTVLLLYLDPVAAVPLHGLIQLASNGARTWVQRRHLEWRLVRRFCVLLLPATALGVQVLSAVPAQASRVAIGVFALLATWWPRALLLGRQPEATNPPRLFLLLGGLTGFASATLGAVGPLLGPFFRGLGLARQGVIGTFAACQSAGHAAKVVLFGVAGFSFADHVALLAVCVAGVVAGTALGSRLLDRLSERHFERLYRAALTLIALRLIFAGA